MKRKVSVTIEKTVELEINDECLTDKFLDEFEGCIGDLEVDAKGSRIDGLFLHAASQIAQYEEISFIEGIGKSGAQYLKNRPECQDMEVFYSVDTDYVGTEVEWR